jgi:peptidoglycan hydrolase CwlO-like protein
MRQIQLRLASSLIVIALSALIRTQVEAVEPAEAATTNPGSNADTQSSQINLKDQQNNDETAKAVNKVPGVNVQGKDLQPPPPETPIRGFHPIKKMLQPVVRLEKNSVQLEQQIMKLEGPIAGLQPAMISLHKKMGAVEKKMGSVQGHIDDVGNRIEGVGTRVNDVSTRMKEISQQMTAVRGDISSVRKEIGVLEGPIKDLHKPLAEVARPLLNVEQKLEKLAALLTTVLFAILLAAGIIAIGTPIAAILIYRNRRKLFPDMSDRDFPVAKASEVRPTIHASKT